MKRLSVFILLFFYSHVDADSDWTYWGATGPESWPGECNTGTRQSPINIETENAVKTDLGSLKFLKYDYASGGTITNTGHSVQIKLNDMPMHLKGADLTSTYILEQMHFHWDAEHTVDDVRDALELHFVHYNKEYENASVAAEHEGGIAVVATLFELSNERNPDLIPVLESATLVSKWVGKNTADLRSKIIPYLFLPKDHTTYYRYNGSLTTPGCQESVKWFVLAEKLTISSDQLSTFKNIWSHSGYLLFNYRPVQSLGDRKVFHHLEGYSAATTLSSNLLHACLSVLLVKILTQ